MERVIGIGGFFFRAHNTDALNRWYAEHLGVVPPAGNYQEPGWFPDRGETVFTAFSPDSDAFGSAEKTWKINFRVSDLDAMVGQLRTAGIDVRLHEREYPNGRFAELADPEGNPTSYGSPMRPPSRATPPGKRSDCGH